jgi:NAD(P)-dependent dehydrogenase (short-subunit alcohol dehydrogenase family)
VKIEGTATLVTGGASGLGLATVERLAAAGAHVTIVDLPTSQGKEIAEKLGDSVSFAPPTLRMRLRSRRRLSRTSVLLRPLTFFRIRVPEELKPRLTAPTYRLLDLSQ